jgi:D-arabinose 1-dehydrogenase-like Zn-dependent alcohol dehydrogenase
MGLRVVAIGKNNYKAHGIFPILTWLADSGAEKKELCLKLGAEKWIDFNESKDLVKDVKDACGGLGPHCALVTANTVRMPPFKLLKIGSKY